MMVSLDRVTWFDVVDEEKVDDVVREVVRIERIVRPQERRRFDEWQARLDRTGVGREVVLDTVKFHLIDIRLSIREGRAPFVAPTTLVYLGTHTIEAGQTKRISIKMEEDS